MMLHITPGSNGYFENVWAWVADHDLDDAQNAQVSVAVARGVLVEAHDAVWMYGTASEHSMLYQYAFVNSTNTFAGMMQTESPYFQGTAATQSQSPGPFNASVGLFAGDPKFPDPHCKATAALCNVGWALLMSSTTNLTIAGAGLYSWFDNYVESCVDSQNCQQRLVLDAGGNQYLALWNLITIGSVEMVSTADRSEVILAKNNTQSLGHPFWSALAGYLDADRPIYYSCPMKSTSADGGTCADYFDDPCDSVHDMTFETFDSMAVAVDLGARGLGTNIPSDCRDNIAISTLANVAHQALDNYTNINDGYDNVYGHYESAQRDQIIQIITDYMVDANGPGIQGAGNKYFDCIFKNEPSKPCPPDANDLTGYTLTYKPTNLTGFYADLNSTYGIPSDWVTFTTTTLTSPPVRTCAPNMRGGGDCGEGRTKIILEGLPVPIPKDKIPVINPKDALAKALPLMRNISTSLDGNTFGTIWGAYEGSPAEVLQAYSLPVFQYQVALQGMAAAKTLGQQAADAAQNQLVEEILGAVLAILPFAVELIPLLGPLEGFLDLVNTIGNLGLTASQIKQDPSSAPFAILGLLGGGGGRSEGDIGKLAKIRRDNPAKQSTIGQRFKELDDTFQTCVKKTCI